MSREFVNVYQQLRDAGAEIDNHYSDLYVKATPEVWAIVKASGWTHETFRSQLDGQLWIDIAFAYSPYWEKRTPQ